MSIKKISNSTEDIKALQAIAKQTFTETFGSQNTAEDLAKFLSEEYDFDKLKAEVENPESFYYFYYFEDELAGYLKLNVGAAQTESDYPEALEIQRIYVLQKYQGKRIGLAMMQQALAVAKKLKKPQVWLGVWENNLKAQAFYQKSGFKKVGSHDFILGDDKQTDYILLKTL
ncbi:GNAT family N-acetyltransferase [Ligilactobacillus salivarius]|jgi:ribosomal protein S18 acetylase RimI-like enzyme|uniref:GNAT family N-acetyltransferase n=1 Tax=Ligilactobacillus salivarius TaxID=1624 RepID=A0A1V9S989_9LACO|nr:GNAT family N-acetyltransferase [Ligilactobacillus salivarius]ARU19221.1 GNAT family N-acetyltransferase [Ligilactobacillus salivarius]ATP36053.1 N-acetyltransferase [Ligilactobacillus salivarius]OQR01759.1 GNAT family N-acetyltransferase [Ligilactobacillus salivarius]OQR01878.1 GNAT family N-acetyltransferase [Ligilactobacillus salivarius]TXJ76963.1 GNAT family N-acetyltransferase [Ligilactobacillus salivarius]